MDLLIKNMEMPKSCGECRFAVNAYGSLTEGKCAVLGYGVTYMRERHDACPLVEVPTPHGELCDKDKLREATKNTEVRNSRGEIYPIGKAIAKMIDEAPTVLEATE